jgi:glycine/D-amino acid oxidase-like deaminating enzyme
MTPTPKAQGRHAPVLASLKEKRSMTAEHTIHDLMVIGGGVNGTGIAMDAAGRGLSVVLCEMNDLASATSSNSSKLIHGGLRYLEHYEFRLVKEALAERESLLRNAPHIMWPLRFRLPHRPHLRPAWMIRIGLFLYDHLAKRELLPGSNGIRFGADSPLVSDIAKGFEYSDGWVDDARLVVLCAMAARQSGADIKTRTRCVRAERQDGLWLVTLQEVDTGRQQRYRCRALVNAAGPWASKLFDEAMTLEAPKQIRLVKGSHIIVPKLHDEPEAYILQNEDNRIVFVIPYEDNFSLIGTTDVDYQGNPSEARISDEEVEYLCAVVNAHFKRKINAADVVWTYSGVRPLMDDEHGQAQKASRDYSLRGRCPQRRGAAAVGVRRQDHHLPQAGGGRHQRHLSFFPPGQGALDQNGSAARRQLRGSRQPGRGLTAAVPLVARGHDQAVCAHLRQPLPPFPGRLPGPRGSGRILRCHPHPEGSGLPGGVRMGQDSGRHHLAPQQAGPVSDGSGAGTAAPVPAKQAGSGTEPAGRLRPAAQRRPPSSRRRASSAGSGR